MLRLPPVTIVTTLVNAAVAQSRVDRGATPNGATITVTAIPFPAVEAGLAEGRERMDLLRSQAEIPRFVNANNQFGEAVARYFRARGETPRRRPSCIISGMCQTWTLGLARELGVPCYVFHGFGAFALLCIEYLYKHRPHESVASADELFDVPVLALDPVSPIFSPCLDPHAMRDDARRCMAWLDAKDSRSVVYVSFGSAGRLPPAQVMQLGMALVSCPWPVLWVLKGADSLPEDPTENVLTAINPGGGEAEAEAEVGMEQILKTLERLMGHGAEREQRWQKAQELKVKAKGSLEKDGSSHRNLEKLIQSFI
ncbi:hypothetical protein EJB05_38654, partial [Eragrostis curvula]